MEMTVIALWSREHKLLLRVTAPLGALMSLGLGLKIDDKDVGKVGFVRCTSENCIAEAILDDNLLNNLQTGKVATFSFFLTPSEGTGFPFSLSGFAEAVAALRA